VVAIVDTNCNPDDIDHPIPANDDAIRAIKLITTKIADATVEGKVSEMEAPTEETGEVEEMTEAVPEEVETTQPITQISEDK
jgi:small subunit ribosomal protein S2